MPKVIDAFTFFNEVDLLRVRLEEMAPVVDAFVVVESGQTFAGKAKPFFFEANVDLFSDFRHKILYMKLPYLPPLEEDSEPNRFRLEECQRNFILYGCLQLGLSADDIVLVSDIDEIPRREAIPTIEHVLAKRTTAALLQVYHKHFLDAQIDENLRRQWVGPVATRFGHLCRHGPQNIRRAIAHAGEFLNAVHTANPNLTLIDDAGWHLTYFGGKEAHDYKLVNFAHGTRYAGQADADQALCITKDDLRESLLPFDTSLAAKLETYQDQVLHFDVPQAIRSKLGQFYHVFGQSWVAPPPYFKIR